MAPVKLSARKKTQATITASMVMDWARIVVTIEGSLTPAKALFGNHVPTVIDDQIEAMQQPPEDEGPGRAVPQATKHHGRHEIEIAPGRAMLVAAKGNIEIVTQETGQGDMPAAPELDDRAGLVGAVEVDRQANAEHARQT